MSEEYFIAAGGESKGPYSLAQIEWLRDKGLIPADAQYWSEGMDDWYIIDNLLEGRIDQPQVSPLAAPILTSPVGVSAREAEPVRQRSRKQITPVRKQIPPAIHATEKEGVSIAIIVVCLATICVGLWFFFGPSPSTWKPSYPASTSASGTTSSSEESSSDSNASAAGTSTAPTANDFSAATVTFEAGVNRVKRMASTPFLRIGNVEHEIQAGGSKSDPILGILIIHHPTDDTDDDMLNAQKFVFSYQGGAWHLAQHSIWISSAGEWQELKPISDPVMKVCDAFGINAFTNYLAWKQSPENDYGQYVKLQHEWAEKFKKIDNAKSYAIALDQLTDSVGQLVTLNARHPGTTDEQTGYNQGYQAGFSFGQNYLAAESSLSRFQNDQNVVRAWIKLRTEAKRIMQ